MRDGCFTESLPDEKFLDALGDEVFFLFSNLIYRISGIRLGIQKKGLLISRLTRRLKALGIGGFYDYYQTVRDDAVEQTEMINCISTNTTKFFRENHHFVYLGDVIIPELLRMKSADKVIRIWSAGCSTGEEPYSIAMTLQAAFAKTGIKPEGWDIKILATDISTRVLGTAQSGVYECGQLPDSVQAEDIRKYFLKGDKWNEGKVKVKDAVKGMIRFSRFNLKSRIYPFKKKFDVIFCRNVMIYFDEDMKRHVLSGFHYHLSDNGYVFLGHSETMFKMDQFIPVHITVYKKRAEGHW
ncbi:MAG: protein-glutamate O-methyltransferase CheR [Nitrospirae bacterium]|nr:protein-glutamate O-methyltransferase CheR [Nitrospirota bacterium]MCL5237040.1 protein-glutamate O-methyltransferase CheR [Nitrospirota bacterium]